MTISKTCGSCKYLRAKEYWSLNHGYIDHIEYECRRFPPTPGGAFGKTDLDDWCGEFKETMI